MEKTSTEDPTTRTERDTALCRSLLYEALALGFRPPTAQTCERLGTESAAAALSEAAAFLDEKGSSTGLRERTRAIAVPPAASKPEVLGAEFARLFGHTARGPVPPYETEYGEDALFQKPQEMSDIAGFFKAFSLVLDPAAHERIDHVSCELEFLSFLARKEAHALETGDGGMLKETRKGERLFLGDHLARFAPSFSRRLQREDPRGFYGALARLCSEFVKTECSRFGVTPGSDSLPIRIPLDDGAPMACGVPEGCAPGPGCPGSASGGGEEMD
jgi:DMSO reductase family type II enzyme chaperone